MQFQTQVYIYTALPEERMERSITTWHTVRVAGSAFRKYVMEYVKKGYRVIIDGSIGYSKSVTPEGVERLTATIHASKLWGERGGE